MPNRLLSCCRATASPPPQVCSSVAYQSVVIPPGPPHDPPIHAGELKRAFQMLAEDGARFELDAHLSGTRFHHLIERGQTLPASDEAASREVQDLYVQAREIYAACYRRVWGSTPEWRDRPVRQP